MDCDFQSIVETEMEKHPLLVNVIIRRILQYLPLKDVKQCRFVCREWDSEAFPLLNRQSSINLNREIEIQDFLKYVNSEIQEPRQFTSFRLFHVKYSNFNHISELQRFFDTCGKNIHRLALRNAILANQSQEFIKVLDISQWITFMADTLVELDIGCLGGFGSANFTKCFVPLGQLSSLKIISISHCRMTIDSLEKRISPTKLTLDNVEFYQKGQKLTEICLNDIIDFSKCREIIVRSKHNNWTFDMSKDLINAQKLEFCGGGKIINWEIAEAKIHSLKLKTLTTFLTKSKIEYKKLEFHRYVRCEDMLPMLNLCVLSKKLEKLVFTYDSHTIAPYKIDLPNLNSLKVILMRCTSLIPVGELNIMARFSICSNLNNIELFYFSPSAVSNLNWFPRSIRRLKLEDVSVNRFMTENDADQIENDNTNYIKLETLVLQCCLNDAENFLRQIKPNILVLFTTVSLRNNNVISFVHKNQHLEKIIIKIVYYKYDSKKVPFTSTQFSKFVDRKSDYYEFVKQEVGRSISADEFYTYHDFD